MAMGQDLCPQMPDSLSQQQCNEEYPCGDYHPGLSILYPRDFLSYIPNMEAEQRIGGGVLELRCFASGALCGQKYQVEIQGFVAGTTEPVSAPWQVSPAPLYWHV